MNNVRLSLEQEIQALDTILNGEIINLGFQFEVVMTACICTIEVREKGKDEIKRYTVIYAPYETISGDVYNGAEPLMSGPVLGSKEYHDIINDLYTLRDNKKKLYKDRK